MSDPSHSCEILSQGDEVVTGQIADTNAAWLSERLTDLGFVVRRHTAVGDRLDDLVTAFREVASRCDLCVCTGGLGPTEDDLTAQAVADAFSSPLELDPIALQEIEERFRQFGRHMAPVNRKQALLPRGSERLTNLWGTAPGFAFSAGRAWFACVPGVPREMRAMYESHVAPRVLQRFTVRPGRLVTLRTLGVGESDLQTALGDWRPQFDRRGGSAPLAPPEYDPRGGSAEFDRRGGSAPLAPPEFALGFRTMQPENHLKLRFGPSVSEAEVTESVQSVLERVGRWVYTIEGLAEPISGWDCGGGDPAAVLGRALAASGHTLAVAESCSGGRLAAACTAVPGASEWFLEGVVSYANDAKMDLLGVSAADLAAHGAVSEIVARAMARGIRLRAASTWGIGITGIAGPGGGTADKPVGTVHVAVDGPTGSTHRALLLPGDRERVQLLSVATSLELLRRQLIPSSPA